MSNGFLGPGTQSQIVPYGPDRIYVGAEAAFQDSNDPKISDSLALNGPLPSGMTRIVGYDLNVSFIADDTDSFLYMIFSGDLMVMVDILKTAASETDAVVYRKQPNGVWVVAGTAPIGQPVNKHMKNMGLNIPLDKNIHLDAGVDKPSRLKDWELQGFLFLA